jgi:hypothetical protein
VNIAAGVEECLGNLGALLRVFHVEDEKTGSLAAFEAEICRFGLELLDEAPIAFCRAPDFSAALPWAASM